MSVDHATDIANIFTHWPGPTDSGTYEQTGGTQHSVTAIPLPKRHEAPSRDPETSPTNLIERTFAIQEAEISGVTPHLGGDTYTDADSNVWQLDNASLHGEVVWLFDAWRDKDYEES